MATVAVSIRCSDMVEFDRAFRREGYSVLAGVDEAGRGPWAGPVVAAAVIMPGDMRIDGIDDSKKLTPGKREALFRRICGSCRSFSVGIVNHRQIDSLNILQATRRSIRRALDGLSVIPDLCLIDGNMDFAQIRVACRSIVKGDALSFSIACASIIAKVTRDRIMERMDGRYPGWGFFRHKGYGTAAHREALDKQGLSPVHRLSFMPMKEMAGCVSIS